MRMQNGKNEKKYFLFSFLVFSLPEVDNGSSDVAHYLPHWGGTG